jgi:hypothetical protein
MDMSKDLVAASATPLVLAILAEGDSYGYAIIKRVAELSGGHHDSIVRVANAAIELPRLRHSRRRLSGSLRSSS